MAAAAARPLPARLRAAALTLALSGLAFAVDVGSFHISLTGTNVANASFIGNVAPVLAVVGGALFFRERAQPRVWPALALALVGAWVMAGMRTPHVGRLGRRFRAQCGGRLRRLSDVHQARPRQPRRAHGDVGLCGGLGVGPGGRRRRARETLLPSSPRGWAVVFLLGFVSHAMGQGLTSVALGRVPVAQVALVILAQPPVSALLAWAGARRKHVVFAGGGRNYYSGGGVFGAAGLSAVAKD